MSLPQLSDIIFSQPATPTLNGLLTDLKRTSLSITNRLHSIYTDAQFVNQVAAAYDIPLLANERCGSWYVDPDRKAGSAYFKSTDGHTGQWGFSGRRLNLQVLDIVGNHGGAIIVDSTRRGKPMPDALSKTIPIWACVINGALFPSQPSAHQLYTPPNVVSRSEHAQIEALIPSFLESLKALDLDLPQLRKKLGDKPIRCLWVTPDSHLPEVHDHDEGDNVNGRPKILSDAVPLILVTASRRVIAGEMGTASGSTICTTGSGTSFVYVQGAADDTENWARNLTAPVWWQHRARLLSTADADLDGVVDDLVSAAQVKSSSIIENNEGGNWKGWKSHATEVAPCLWVGVLPLGETVGAWGDGDTARILLSSHVTAAETWRKSESKIVVGLGRHKVASRNLRRALPAICEFAGSWLRGGEAEMSDRAIMELEPLKRSTLSLGGGEIGETCPESTLKPSDAGVNGVSLVTATNDDDTTTPRSKKPTTTSPPLASTQSTILPPSPRQILISCPTGYDLSIGVTLAINSLLFTDPGFLRVRTPSPERTTTSSSPSSQHLNLSKTVIKRRMARIASAMAAANPHRATLQSVNSFLLE